MNTINVSRRAFLRSSAVVGGGLVIGFSLSGCSAAPLPIVRTPNDFVPNAFLQLTEDNQITFYCPRDEMGQGVMTGLATLIAEELDVDPMALTVVHCEVHPDYNNPAMGMQMTGGSTSVNAHYLPLRQAGANTRALLIEAAATRLGVDAGTLSTDNGGVVHEGTRYPYGNFVQSAATLTLAEDAPLKQSDAFRYIGKHNARVDAIAKSTGTADFGLDAVVEGMKHAVVVRAPTFGAKVISLDSSAAESMPGEVSVVRISSGVAVVANTYWQARSASRKLNIEWETIPTSTLSTTQIRAELTAALDSEDSLTVHEAGDLAAGYANTTTEIEGTYWTPYLAHAPMEPVNATIRLGDNHAEIWLGIQSAQAVQNLVSRIADIPVENIVVHNLYLGGGFGRRGTATHVIEVTEIAQAVGKPIKLMWTREDDIQGGLYRPAAMARVRAGVAADGTVSAWDVRRAGGDLMPETLKNMIPAMMPGMPDALVSTIHGAAEYIFQNLSADPSAVEGLHETYSFGNALVSNNSVNHGVPLTFWRSVGHSGNAFVSESALDELAVAANLDPVDLRLSNTLDKPRMHNVIRVAGEHMRQMKPAEGRHLGFAAHSSFQTDVAQIAEVSVEGSQIRVHKVVCVVDCGTAVNPDVVRAQMEGGIMFGLTAALHGKIELADGRVVQSNFHDYPILRMNEAPEVEVVIIESTDAPTGVGEPGVPPIAPAVANAVFRATGQRLRELPLQLA